MGRERGKEEEWVGEGERVLGRERGKEEEWVGGGKVPGRGRGGVLMAADCIMCSMGAVLPLLTV